MCIALTDCKCFNKRHVALTLSMSKSGCTSKSGHLPNPGTWPDTVRADAHTSSRTDFALDIVITSTGLWTWSFWIRVTKTKIPTSGSADKTSVWPGRARTTVIYTRAGHRRNALRSPDLLDALVRQVRCVNHASPASSVRNAFGLARRYCPKR